MHGVGRVASLKLELAIYFGSCLMGCGLLFLLESAPTGNCLTYPPHHQLYIIVASNIKFAMSNTLCLYSLKVVLMVIYNLLMEGERTRGEWKCAHREYGEQCVMMTGT